MVEKQNNKTHEVLAHKQCGKPIIIENYGHVNHNTTLKDAKGYCCDRPIDLGDFNEVYYVEISKEKFDKVRKIEKEKKNGVNSNLKTIEDKLAL